MANAKKCDRCGAFYEYYEGIKHGEKTTKTQLKTWELIDKIEHDANSISAVKAYTNSTQCGIGCIACCQVVDLCPNCMQEFINFIRKD